MKTKTETAAYQKAYRQKHKERLKEQQRAYWHKPENAGRKRSRGRAWTKSNPEYQANRHIKRRYGITVAEVQDLRQRQEGTCAICGAEGKRLVIDHDHETGVIRGLLCDRCNVVLGNVENWPEVVNACQIYLVTHLVARAA
jgi:hypothetical protein